MGTFHDDRHELHGITIVVDTDREETFVGRCDDVDAGAIIMVDADVHREEGEGLSREEYLDRAARLGVWKKYDRLVIPRARVTSVRRLGDLERQ